MQRIAPLWRSGRRGSLGCVTGVAMLAAVFCAAGPATAGDFGISIGGMRANVPVQSIMERRWETVIRQQRDFSCGAAAVATLLTHHYDRPTDEIEVFDAMFAAGDQAKIMQQGFSLLDMKHFLESRGYAGDGYRIAVDKLLEAGIPAIAIVTIRGYRHFVVVKGITEDMVLVGDPALGVKEYSRGEFEDMLSNDIFFVIRDAVETARAHFNLDAEWDVNPSAPFGDATNQGSLASFTLSLPSPDGLGRSR